MWDRLKLFLNPFDARYEEMRKGNWRGVVLRDISAGLIVAMMAIPMAMGFAMASGLRPEPGRSEPLRRCRALVVCPIRAMRYVGRVKRVRRATPQAD